MIKFRTAVEDDIPFLAIATRTAERGHRETGLWDFIYTAEKCLPFLEGWIQSSDMFFHYSNFFIAYVFIDGDEVPIASALSYVYGNIDFEKWEGIEKSIALSNGWTVDEISKLQERWSQVIPCMPKYGSPNTLVIECVATVDLRYRKMGIQTQLITNLLDIRSKDSNCVNASLSCLADNAAAQSLYEKLGFRKVQENLSPEFAAALVSPGFIVMSRQINAL